MPVSEDIVRIREDVAYIRAKVEVLPDHENRIRLLEKFRYGIPGVALLGLAVSVITAGFALFN